MPPGLFSLRLMFKRLKSESMHEVNVIGDTLSYDFPHTESAFMDGRQQVRI